MVNWLSQNRIRKFFSHPLVSVLIGTGILTTVMTVYLTNYYQRRLVNEQRAFEVYRENYDNAVKLVNELSQVMSRRHFGLNKVVWVAKGSGTGELTNVWDEYYQSVNDWNNKRLYYRQNLSHWIGNEVANSFDIRYDPLLTEAGGNSNSIHGLFYRAHINVRKLKDCVHDECSEKATLLEQAERDLDNLGIAIERFIEVCYAKINQRTLLNS